MLNRSTCAKKMSQEPPTRNKKKSSTGSARGTRTNASYFEDTRDQLALVGPAVKVSLLISEYARLAVGYVLIRMFAKATVPVCTCKLMKPESASSLFFLPRNFSLGSAGSRSEE